MQPAVIFRFTGNRGGTVGHRPSGRAEPGSDVMVERFNHGVPGHFEPAAEVVPRRDAQLVAGLGETQKRIATIATGIAARPAADLPPCDVAADVVLRPV